MIQEWLGINPAHSRNALGETEQKVTVLRRGTVAKQTLKTFHVHQHGSTLKVFLTGR